MSPSVLVVDDSPMVRSLHAFMLESAGYRVREAENGGDGLEQLLREPVDLLVTDINMPVMDGYELCRRVRALPEYRDLPILMISTESQARDKARGFEAGANLYLVKPVDRDVLLHHAAMLLGRGAGPGTSEEG